MSLNLKSNKTLKPTFFPAENKCIGNEVVLLISSGLTLEILDKDFQFGIFCCKNVSDCPLWVKTWLLQSNFAIG